MSKQELAGRFAALHVKGRPLVLFNAWDAGSAKAIANAGAPAIATSSWAVAAAHGYDDGQAIPFALVEQIMDRVVRAVDIPVSVDVEGAYSDDPETAAKNVARLIDIGVVGINFEDRVVQQKSLHAVAAQAARIAAIRAAAQARGVELFINARTDVFFGAGIAPDDMQREALARARAYADAGASGIFMPGLVDLRTIGVLAAAIELPLNVMSMPNLPDAGALASAGVARISHGPGAYVRAMEAVRTGAQSVYGAGA